MLEDCRKEPESPLEINSQTPLIASLNLKLFMATALKGRLWKWDVPPTFPSHGFSLRPPVANTCSGRSGEVISSHAMMSEGSSESGRCREPCNTSKRALQTSLTTGSHVCHRTRLFPVADKSPIISRKNTVLVRRFHFKVSVGCPLVLFLTPRVHLSGTFGPSHACEN